MADKVLGRKGNATEDQLKALDSKLDRHDPLYDSESEGDIYFETYRPSQGDHDRQALQRSASTYVRHRPTSQTTESIPYPEYLQIITEQILPDALVGEDSGEVCEALKELNCPQYNDAFVVRAVRASLDHSIEKQKWMSELLTILYDSKIVSRAAANRGFEKLIQQAEDIKLDVPDANRKILNFMKCGVDDGVLDPTFLLRIPETFLHSLIPSEDIPEEYALSGIELEDLRHHLKTLKIFKSAIEEFVVNDFMMSGSQEDLEQLLSDLGHPEFKHEVVRRLVKVSMGLTDIQRELVSSTLSDRFGTDDLNFTPDDILVGFIRVLGEIEDIRIDVPEVSTMLAKFLVRAVVDEILPPIVILDCMRLGIGNEEGKRITKTVKNWVLEERKGALHVSKFHKVWTATNPDQPETKVFKQKIRDIILQHFDDNDVGITYQQLDDLEMSPDQSVIFIRKVLELSMERTERERKVSLALLKALLLKGDLYPQIIRQGFDQAWNCLPDLSVDIPDASNYLQSLVSHAQALHILPDDYVKP